VCVLPSHTAIPVPWTDHSCGLNILEKIWGRGEEKGGGEEYNGGAGGGGAAAAAGDDDGDVDDLIYSALIIMVWLYESGFSWSIVTE
jgi:hypothetical protein